MIEKGLNKFKDFRIVRFITDYYPVPGLSQIAPRLPIRVLINKGSNRGEDLLRPNGSVLTGTTSHQHYRPPHQPPGHDLVIDLNRPGEKKCSPAAGSGNRMPQRGAAAVPLGEMLNGCFRVTGGARMLVSVFNLSWRQTASLRDRRRTPADEDERVCAGSRPSNPPRKRAPFRPPRPAVGGLGADLPREAGHPRDLEPAHLERASGTGRAGATSRIGAATPPTTRPRAYRGLRLTAAGESGPPAIPNLPGLPPGRREPPRFEQPA